MSESSTSGLVLVHFGVKGMKWGVRRGSDGVRPIARTLDQSKFGQASKRNVDRYNKKKYGTKPTTPPREKKPRSKLKTAAKILAGAYIAKFAYNVVKAFGPIAVSSLVTNKNAANGAKYAASLLADKGLTNYKTVVLGG